MMLQIEGQKGGLYFLYSIPQLIILMSDHQTIGVYPLLGCIAKVGLPQLAQAAPGATVNFIEADITKATTEWLTKKRFFRQ